MREVAIPDGWRKVRLSELCEPNAPIMYGILQPGPEIEDGIPYVRPTEIADDRIKLEEIKRTSPEIAAKYRRAILKAGDLLITIVGTLGKIAVVPPELEGANITQSSARIRLAPKVAHARYVRQILRSPVAIRQYDYCRLGTGVPRLNIHHVRDLEIPLPPLAEQRRIAAVLDRAEALRAKRRQALAKLDTLTQSLFLDLFGDPVTNPKGWERVQLGQMVERITKGESPGWQGFDYQNDGALFVTSENVRLGAIDLSAPKFIPLEFNRKLFRSELRPGDLLVNLVGASIGRSCIFPGYECPANINQAVAVVTVNSSLLENTFLSGLLTSERGQWLLLNNRVEGARANISLTDLRELNLPLPPISLQREFARRVTVVEALKTAQRASLAEMDALFATLQHRAFKGEIK